jgi:ssDNA-binding Zn-finger/Zn-ribbon topoisomerase 1
VPPLKPGVRRKKMKEKTNSGKQGTAPDQPADTRTCPKCGAEMMKGEIRGGLSNGRSVWACTNFPKCGHTEVVHTPEEKAILEGLKRGMR